MNSKLRNTLSAFAASGATLAIALMVAVPAHQPAMQSVAAQTPEDAIAASFERRAESMGALAKAATLSDALSAGAVAASVLALEADRDMEAPTSSRTSGKVARHRRQTVVMPYFSFSPRG